MKNPRHIQPERTERESLTSHFSVLRAGEGGAGDDPFFGVTRPVGFFCTTP